MTQHWPLKALNATASSRNYLTHISQPLFQYAITSRKLGAKPQEQDKHARTKWTHIIWWLHADRYTHTGARTGWHIWTNKHNTQHTTHNTQHTTHNAHTYSHTATANRHITARTTAEHREHTEHSLQHREAPQSRCLIAGSGCKR